MNEVFNLDNQNRQPFRKYEVYFFALIAEILVLGGVFFVVIGQFKTTPINNNTINLVFNEAPITPLLELEKKPTKVVKELSKTPVKTPTPVKTTSPQLTKSSEPSEALYQQQNKPSENTPSAPNTVATPSVSKVENKPDPMTQYQGQVRAAIQSAVVCTSAAKDLNASGKTRVQFNLKDTQQSGGHVVTGSGIPFLDNSALIAVQNARYPKPPEEFIGENKLMTVLVVLNCGN